MEEHPLFACIRNRRSVRRFTAAPVDAAVLAQVLDAARWAPSNHNRQAWKFLVIRSAGMRDRMRDAVEQAITEYGTRCSTVPQPFLDDLRRHALVFHGAPVVIAALHRRPTEVALEFLARTRNPWLVSGEAMSTAMAVQNLLLAAEALGLGACIMTAPLVATEQLEALLGIHGPHELNCLVALGYPAETQPTPGRKRLDQVMASVEEPHDR